MRKFSKITIFLILFSTKLQASSVSGKMTPQFFSSFAFNDAPLLSRMRCFRKLTFLRHFHFSLGMKMHFCHSYFNFPEKKPFKGVESFDLERALFINPSPAWFIGLLGGGSFSCKRREQINSAAKEKAKALLENEIGHKFTEFSELSNKLSRVDLEKAESRFKDLEKSSMVDLTKKNKSSNAIAGCFVEYHRDRFALSALVNITHPEFDTLNIIHPTLNLSGMWQPLPQPTFLMLSLHQIASIKHFFDRGAFAVHHQLAQKWDGVFSLHQRLDQKSDREWTISLGVSWALNRDSQSMGKGVC